LQDPQNLLGNKDEKVIELINEKNQNPKTRIIKRKAITTNFEFTKKKKKINE